MKPERLIGKKVRGFKFDKSKPCSYNDIMDKLIGKIGVIDHYFEYNNSFKVDFEDGNNWFYPADQIEAHLVEDEIPTLSDGVMMLVSHNQTDWFKRKVFGIKNDLFYTFSDMFKNDVIHFKYAKPLEPTKEEQLTAILGSSDKVKEIMGLFKNYDYEIN